MRQRLCSNSEDISFAAKLWQGFSAVITGILNEMTVVLNDTVILVMETIEKHIQCLFVPVLQLNPKTLRLEALQINGIWLHVGKNEYRNFGL